MTFGGGVREQVTVGAIYDDADLLSDVVVPSALWDRHALQPTESAVLINTRRGSLRRRGPARRSSRSPSATAATCRT